MKNPKTIALLVVSILVLIFLIQNASAVTLRLYFWEVSMPQIILIPLVLLVGFGCGFAAGRLRSKKK